MKRHVVWLAVAAFVALPTACGREDVTGVPAPSASRAGDAGPLRDAIAFFTYEFGATGNLAVMNADGTERRALPGGERGFEPAISPDGRRIVFSRSATFGTIDVFVMNLDGTGTTRLVPGLVFTAEPVWSPDGCQIAFRSVGAGPTGRISIINADGTGLRQLTPDEHPGQDFAFDEGPTWSPDGRRLAFTRNSQLYVINADGTGMTALPNEDMAQNPAWSPDGQQIAYWSLDPLGQIRVRNADGSNVRSVTTGADFDSWPRWSRDGRRLVFNRFTNDRSQVFTSNVDGTGVAALTPAGLNDYMPDWSHAPATSRCNTGVTITIEPGAPTLEPGATVQLTATVRATGGTIQNAQVQWSSSDPTVATVTPSGLVTAVTNGTAQIQAMVGNVTGAATVTVREPVVLRNVIVFTTEEFGARELAIVNPDGSGRRRLTTNQFYYSAPDISPNGRRIVFAGLSGIFVMDADGTGIAPVISRSSDFAPTWSPDGSRIAFTSDTEGPYGITRHVFVVNVDGTGLRQVTTDGPDPTVLFSDEYPSWSPDGSKIAFTRNTQLMVVNADGTGLRAVSDDYAVYPDWSPDGTRIAYVNLDIFWGIRVRNVDGSNPVTVLQAADLLENVRWSPDGRRLTFARLAPYGQIHVINADGSGEVTVSAVPGFMQLEPAWSPLP